MQNMVPDLDFSTREVKSHRSLKSQDIYYRGKHVFLKDKTLKVVINLFCVFAQCFTIATTVLALHL